MHILEMGKLRHKLVKLLAQMSSRLHMKYLIQPLVLWPSLGLPRCRGQHLAAKHW